MPTYASPTQSSAWLKERMAFLGIANLEDLAAIAGTDKGNLSRIFRQVQRPRVDALEPLAAALDVSIYELLVRIGAVDPQRTDIPQAHWQEQSLAFRWSKAV